MFRHRQPKPPLHHEEDRVVQAHKLLVDQGMIETIDELIAYAEKGGHRRQADFFRTLQHEPIPASLALEELVVINRKNGHRRDRELLEACADQKVALVMPLPPHVHEPFLAFTNVTLVIPNGHHVPHHFRHSNVDVRQGFRAGRQVILESDIIVFEVYAEGDAYFADPDVADLIDEPALQPNARLVVHLRPHHHPDDVEIALASRQINRI